MAHFFYNLIIILYIILYSLVYLYQILTKRKRRAGFWERLGFYSFAPFTDKDFVIWVHAVSVGETVAAAPVVMNLKKNYPHAKILFSTITDTGQELAKKTITQAHEVIYFPLDLPFAITRALNHIKPQLLLVTEAELWPMMIRKANKRGIKIGLINGRISDKSAKNYKYLRPLTQLLLQQIHLFCMQSKKDEATIKALGAPPHRVFYTGNTKYQKEYKGGGWGHGEELQKTFSLTPKDKVFVVGSTHHPEEKEILKVYQRLIEKVPDLILILAPRHVERVKELENLFYSANLTTILRTAIHKRKKEQVIFLDTIGELDKVYGLATIVFVGGSLTPIGGHNILEPLFHGKSLLFGPHMSNFQEITSLVLEQRAGIQVNSAEELYEEAYRLLKNDSLQQELMTGAKKLLQEKRGAVKKTIAHISSMLERDRKEEGKE